MVQKLVVYILSILGFIILLYAGMKLSKQKIRYIKISGYILLIFSTIGLLVDFYNLINNYII
jgi:hypothetical protein